MAYTKNMRKRYYKGSMYRVGMVVKLSSEAEGYPAGTEGVVTKFTKNPAKLTVKIGETMVERHPSMFTWIGGKA
jgi:RNase P/RNase MRP subunit p29